MINNAVMIRIDQILDHRAEEFEMFHTVKDLAMPSSIFWCHHIIGKGTKHGIYLHFKPWV